MKTAKECRKNMESFIKEAFCVSGDVVSMERLSNVISEDVNHEGLTFRCSDDRRGVFFVTISQPNQK